MTDMLFQSILTNETGELLASGAVISLLASVIMGAVIAFLYMYKAEYSKNFVVALVILPALVQVVITVVNGNLGASVAVMGAFSLIRFRSVPGNSKDMTAIFFAMAVGLANGMGYVMYSALIVVMVGLVYMILTGTNFGTPKQQERQLKVLIPENLDYTTVFDDIFEKYTLKAELSRVRTSDLGSIFELTYLIRSKDESEDKEMLDALRTRNGNLTITLSRQKSRVAEEI